MDGTLPCEAGGPFTSVPTSGESGEEEVADGTESRRPENPSRRLHGKVRFGLVDVND